MATAREFLIMLRLKMKRNRIFFRTFPGLKNPLKEQSFLLNGQIKRISNVSWLFTMEQNVTTEKFEDFDGERWIIPEDLE